ncbi:MAG: aminopeptidase [Clostridiales bacterium]|nr:aminopeptidase [Clostridiales bacterium]
MDNNKETKKNTKYDGLLYQQKNCYELMPEDELNACYVFAENYKRFLDGARTERLAVSMAVKLAEEKGFRPYVYGQKVAPGDKVYDINRGKALTLAVIGEKPMSAGINLAAAHVDSPRVDIKQVPLYEDSEMAFFKTHYYGGIKKYQWVAIPLELHGVIVKLDGTVIDVSIGAGADEPQFTITDLLPHLGADQMKKTMSEAITGEGLNIVIGSRPEKEAESGSKVKVMVLKLLNEKYGITEADFLSAELMAVPAFAVRDIGFDRSMIGGYGQDDRVCAYCELAAILEQEKPVKTAVCLLVDKEEIGSEGVTGMKSQFFDRFIADLCRSEGTSLYDCFANSFCLSADVSNAFDPNFPEVSEKRNNAKLNYGLSIIKFTGSRGKSGASDATGEVVAKVRKMFAENQVIWQMGELGKVDQGGGGTVAMFTSQRNINTIDAGVPVLSMHAPFEVVSKADLYMAYKGMQALFREK